MKTWYSYTHTPFRASCQAGLPGFITPGVCAHLGFQPKSGDLGGAEQQAMHGRMGRLFGKYTEELFFEGDQSAANPMRYIPTPFHTKYAQERTALSQYTQQEAVGTRMRRWERP